MEQKSDDCPYTLKDAYQKAIEARNFHFENFNKWMTFYYIAIGAILVAFLNVPKVETDRLIGTMLLFLGYIISILWYLSCKGYYFWVLNWIDVIRKIENEIPEELRVYLIFSENVTKKQNDVLNPLKAANISTSKTTMLFSFIVSIAWAILIFDKFFPEDLCSCWKILLAIISTLIVSLVGSTNYLKSSLKNHKLFTFKTK